MEGEQHVQRLRGRNKLGLFQEPKEEACGCRSEREALKGSEYRGLPGHERDFGFCLEASKGH